MNVQMVNTLAAVLAVVDHQSEPALIETSLLGALSRHDQQMAQKLQFFYSIFIQLLR
jgi:hypothetical protein